MTRKTSLVALCSAVALAAAGGAPEWVHLLPAGAIRTVDGRGPYRVASMAELASASLTAGQKLPIDENHAIDKAAAIGLSSPARGWIVELQARDDGLWGRVEWTGEGGKLVDDKAYAGISPAILLSQDGSVLQVLRASLTNTPNLQGLVALHSENVNMDWKAKLIELLGLDGSADDAAIEAALKAKMAAGSDGKTELCAQDLLRHPTVVALQSQLTDLTGQLNSLTDQRSKDAATAFVDAAIAAGRVGVKPARAEYIAMHSASPAATEALIGKLPVLKGSAMLADIPPEADANGLDAADRQVIALMGVNETDYLARKNAAGVRKEAL